MVKNRLNSRKAKRRPDMPPKRRREGFACYFMSLPANAAKAAEIERQMRALVMLPETLS